MCGIVGYTGTHPAKDILLEGLQRLEYRGYDSAGIAIEQEGKLEIAHGKGKVSGLVDRVSLLNLYGTSGIGHTRCATHSKPSESNAHPRLSCDGHVVVVHNGIVENCVELREELEAHGHHFTSQTDTEVVAHLVEENYTGDLLHALHEATSRLIGSYALAIMCDAEPGVIVVARKDLPLVVGRGEQGSYVASDKIALIDATREVVVLENGQMAKLTPGNITYYSVLGEQFYEPKTISID